jgi:ABC-type polysaccharide/polyol phosphate transport system ATPase subunit
MIDVSFDRVAKRYRIERPDAGRRSRLARLLRPRTGDFWAVRDVSFQVGRGETLGIVGHNGAGKSTLLKLLSRITAPTSGEIRLRGTLSALIEVGSGFHPELTGRENIFLSGSILGMRRREIADKLARIVEFSGVGEFIDTPVKRYSSGMFVRLGFAIAAHLEPDILLVDEVLAVGDATFQIQCYERLNELRRGGTTMLFISHDLVSIEKLCDRVILMQHGRLIANGSPHEVIEQYQRMAASASPGTAAIAEATRVGAAPSARLLDVHFRSETGADTIRTTTGGPLVCRVEFQSDRPIDDAAIELFFYSRDGRVLHCQCSTALSGEALRLPAGRGALEFVMAETGLQPGVYSIGATIRQRLTSEAIDWFYGRTLLYVEPGKSVRGYFYTPHTWRVVVVDDEDHVPATAGFNAAQRRHPHL